VTHSLMWPGCPPACWGEEWRAGVWGRQAPNTIIPLGMPPSLLGGGLLISIARPPAATKLPWMSLRAAPWRGRATHWPRNKRSRHCEERVLRRSNPQPGRRLLRSARSDTFPATFSRTTQILQGNTIPPSWGLASIGLEAVEVPDEHHRPAQFGRHGHRAK